ncbi:hypothetical protein ElyMa_004905600 [Elysia marginata]|uniref:Uncharacterized protein n=1 Tax=Elysia marginata TaxID=1093978 RepID=A0AAV4IY57_9GAST|nr:hypothetical protein ElyMa_004905600 [Elysia marginata]
MKPLTPWAKTASFACSRAWDRLEHAVDTAPMKVHRAVQIICFSCIHVINCSYFIIIINIGGIIIIIINIITNGNLSINISSHTNREEKDKNCDWQYKVVEKVGREWLSHI